MPLALVFLHGMETYLGVAITTWIGTATEGIETYCPVLICPCAVGVHPRLADGVSGEGIQQIPCGIGMTLAVADAARFDSGCFHTSFNNRHTEKFVVVGIGKSGSDIGKELGCSES